MPVLSKPGIIFGERTSKVDYLIIGIKLRVTRDVLGLTQAEMAQKFGMKVEQYKKIEEAQSAPDSEKTLKLVRGGCKGLRPIDASVRISAAVVEALFPREGKDD